MKLLLHACCAPCSIECIRALQEEAVTPDLLWYNPNIHPFTEYRSRRNTLQEYAASLNLRLMVEDDYGLRSFVAAVCPDFDDRCTHCYRMRLAFAARYAREHGYDAFCTTLLVSPYQNQELIAQIGEEEAAANGVAFLHRDFRPRFRDGQQSARELGLYLQKYCGCIFSEEERYRKRKNG